MRALRVLRILRALDRNCARAWRAYCVPLLQDSSDPNSILNRPITTGDRAGAGIVTTIVLVGMVGGAYWLLLGGS